jgi:hypothetical protein
MGNTYEPITVLAETHGMLPTALISIFEDSCYGIPTIETEGDLFCTERDLLRFCTEHTLSDLTNSYR